MKIVSIEPIALTAPYLPMLPLPEPPKSNGRNCVWTRIETDDAITGWGEAYCGCYATDVTVAAIRRHSRSIIGMDPSDPDPVLKHMRFCNRYWGMRGIGAQATSAIEGALWDIVGKIHNQPVWKLLGDGKQHPVMIYASDGGNPRTPQEIFEETRYYAGLGFRAYKMSCGGDPDENGDRVPIDRERVKAAREGLGDERFLFVDVCVPQRSENWERGHAERYMQALAPFKPRFMEEPAMTYELSRYRELQALSLIPTAGGESFTSSEEFEPFLATHALGVAQPDAAVVGGPKSCVEVINRARTLGIPVCLHCWCAGVGIAQNIQAACSVDGVLAMEFPQYKHPLATEPIKAIYTVEDGYLTPPIEPGLGVKITEDLLVKYPYVPESDRDY
ncbi:MAG: mandelate racemase/muconate lactonizing enzyme family protein [Candidatus Acidiferrales bacterium]